MIKHGKFIDDWRGDGWFISYLTAYEHVLLAIRKRWHFYQVEPSGKPGYQRWYFGPFELEIHLRPEPRS